MTVIGIDPGKSGAVAIWNEGIDKVIKCPSTPKKMADIIKAETWSTKVVVYIEKVWAFPTDARSSAFKFGTNYGMWLGILGALNIEPELVTPQTWQKHFSKKLPKEKLLRKKALYKIAMSYTEKKIYLYSADAVLIAVYGFMKQDEERK
ncbi:MAG: hypothetical protein CL528_12805 [Aequorivita sp.]|nr:hypothetical protein [Aequorivita sp.]|tara:strand:- start:177 stop:623 length:447 start_codon:yes stop_codon:yes gene_type:complete